MLAVGAADVAVVVDAVLAVGAAVAAAASTAIEKSMPATLDGGIGATCATTDRWSVFD